MQNPAKPASMPLSSPESQTSVTPSMGFPTPQGLSREQVVQAVAYAWLVDPQVMYDGLKVAFNLAPNENQMVN